MEARGKESIFVIFVIYRGEPRDISAKLLGGTFRSYKRKVAGAPRAEDTLGNKLGLEKAAANFGQQRDAGLVRPVATFASNRIACRPVDSAACYVVKSPQSLHEIGQQ